MLDNGETSDNCKKVNSNCTSEWGYKAGCIKVSQCIAVQYDIQKKLIIFSIIHLSIHIMVSIDWLYLEVINVYGLGVLNMYVRQWIFRCMHLDIRAGISSKELEYQETYDHFELCSKEQNIRSAQIEMQKHARNYLVLFGYQGNLWYYILKPLELIFCIII